jgi:hypothetical protein
MGVRMDWCRPHAGIILLVETILDDRSKLVSEAHRLPLLLLAPPPLLPLFLLALLLLLLALLPPLPVGRGDRAELFRIAGPVGRQLGVRLAAIVHDGAALEAQEA